jgi:excisionase family DNA binding protein
MTQTLTLPAPPGGFAILFDHLIERIADLVAARIGPSAPAKRLMDVPAAAEYLGRSHDAVRKLITRGVLPVTKLDGKRQIDRAALDKLISDNTHFEV